MPSHRSNAYGTSVERQVADEYQITLARASWKDADRRDGAPVEIKSARLETADGRPGRFKIYESYHRKLRQNGGYYVLAVYRARGPAAEIVRSTMRHSSRLPRLSWHGGGDHRDTRQAALSVDAVAW